MSFIFEPVNLEVVRLSVRGSFLVPWTFNWRTEVSIVHWQRPAWSSVCQSAQSIVKLAAAKVDKYFLVVLGGHFKVGLVRPRQAPEHFLA